MVDKHEEYKFLRYQAEILKLDDFRALESDALADKLVEVMKKYPKLNRGWTDFVPMFDIKEKKVEGEKFRDSML